SSRPSPSGPAGRSGSSSTRTWSCGRTRAEKERALPGLKLSKLPDRTPVKITITVAPELNAALHAYAELYREAYGEAEPGAALIPCMLACFLAADRGFAKAREDKVFEGRSRAEAAARQPARRGTPETNDPTSTTS